MTHYSCFENCSTVQISRTGEVTPALRRFWKFCKKGINIFLFSASDFLRSISACVSGSVSFKSFSGLSNFRFSLKSFLTSTSRFGTDDSSVSNPEVSHFSTSGFSARKWIVSPCKASEEVSTFLTRKFISGC